MITDAEEFLRTMGSSESMAGEDSTD